MSILSFWINNKCAPNVLFQFDPGLDKPMRNFEIIEL